LFDEGLTQAKRDVVKQLDSACRSTGLFSINGHGVSQNVLTELMQKSYRFFRNTPDDVKHKLAIKKYNPDSKRTLRGFHPSQDGSKEIIDIVSPNFNHSNPGLCDKPWHEHNEWICDETLDQEFFEAYYRQMFRLAKALLRGIALALGKDENFFDAHLSLDSTLSTLRLNYYRFHDNPKPFAITADGIELGQAEHIDVPLLTILYQPEGGGLQAESGPKSGLWVDVTPSTDTFVIFVGEYLAMHTNNVYQATNHRVKIMQRVERISVPFFVDPAADTVLQYFDPDDASKTLEQDTQSYEEYVTNVAKRFAHYKNTI